MPAATRLGEVLREYLDLRKEHAKPSTYASDKMYLDRLLAHVGNIQMRHLEPRHFHGFLTASPPIGVAGLSPGTYNQALTRLRGFDAYCREQGHYGRSLMSRQVKTKADPPKRRTRYTAAQLLALIEAADNPRDRMLVALLANTALRAGEAVALRWGDVNLDEGFIEVTIFKSEKVDRRPITAGLDREIRRWKAYVTAECGFPQDDWYLVPAKSSFRWLMKEGEEPQRLNLGRLRPTRKLGQPYRCVQAALERLGYPSDKEGGHTIRRSVALIYFEKLVAEGYDDALMTVSALLNHANVIVTQRYLGLDRHVEKRDSTLRGVEFLTDDREGATVTVLPTAANVTH